MKLEAPRTQIDWHAHLLAQQQSELTAKAYCQDHHLNYDHFCYRKRKQKPLSAPTENTVTQSSFVPVAVRSINTEQPSAAFSIVLPGGIRIEGVDASNRQLCLELIEALS